MRASSAYSLFDTESVWAILMRIAPPVMLAQLIQAMYNIVDSYFVGQFSSDGLTALSIVYPVQLIVTAIAVGTGVGVNTLMSRYDGQGNHHLADRTAGTGTVLALISWLIFAVLSGLLMRPFAAISTESSSVADLAVTYGTIVCVGSPGVFLESTWSKVHQARGNMRLPMLAQIAGAAANIVLDPILIFGLGPAPALGVAGAAVATVSGQVLAALIVVSGFRKPPPIRVFRSYAAKIYRLGFPSIFMQLLFTVYIMALNMILAGFSDDAVTVLGLYYKVQSFFFIPLSGLQTCIVPLLSYTYAKGAYGRCRRVVKNSVLLAMSFMLVGIACFELIPEQLLRIFTAEPAVLEIGVQAFHIIGISFLPAVPSLILPVFFQAIGAALPSVLLSLTRQILCLIPVFWLFSRIDLAYTWLAFPIAEVVTGTLGLCFYLHRIHIWDRCKGAAPKPERKGATAMKLITAIVNRRDTSEVCAALTDAGFYFTRMASTGGFLTGGNSTLLIGTEEDRVPQAIAIIRQNCSRRTEKISSNVQLATPSAAYPTEVTVGGATLFVSDVTQFEKI